MKSKNNKLIYIIFILITFIFILNYTSFIIKKNIIENSIKEPINYNLNSLNQNFFSIDLLIDKNHKFETNYNKFIKDDIQNLKILIKTKKCEKDFIFIYVKYNNFLYSDIYKINTYGDELYLNLYKSKNNLDFKNFEVHKKDVNCIDKIYTIKNYYLPFSFFINKNDDKIKSRNNKSNFQLFKILSKDKNLFITKNNFTYKNFISELDPNDFESLFYKYYFRNIKKPYYIKDIFLGELYSEDKAEIAFDCKLYKGSAIFLIYDPINYEIFDYMKCSENSNTILKIPQKKLINILIGSTLFLSNSKEIDIKVFFKN